MAREQIPLPTSFWYLSWSNLLAQMSEQIALAAAPLAAVLFLAATAADTGWLQTAQTLPFLLLSLPAGLLADRTSRRWLMLGSEALRTISLAVILGLLLCGALDLRLLALLGFVGAIGTVAYSVAAPALVPGLVARSELTRANRLLELARSGAYAAGPALGGALVGSTGVSPAFAIATMLSLFAMVLLGRLPGDTPTSRPRNLVGDVAEGATFITRHALLRPVLVTAVFFNFGWFVLQAIYVAYAVDRLGLTAAEVGLTLAVYGAGMIAGALAAEKIGHLMAFGSMVLIGPVCGFAAAAMMMLTLWQPSAWLASASFFLFGFGPVIWTISTVTLRQAVTPNDMLGRVSAFVMTATFGARPAGAAAGALVATYAGVGACLVVAVICFLAQLIVIATSRVAHLAQLPEAASG